MSPVLMSKNTDIRENQKNYKKGVDEHKTAWYYMKALTERGTLPKMSKNKLKKCLTNRKAHDKISELLRKSDKHEKQKS